MLRHSRFRPSGSNAKKRTMSPPNMTRRRFGMIFARSAGDRADDGDQDQVQDREVVLAEGQRRHDGEQHRERRHGPLGDRQRINRHVGDIAGLEHAGFAMKHALES
jgi:hypothetical protein